MRDERFDPNRLKVGDHAQLTWAGTAHEVEIIEDAGRIIGVNRRRLVRIRVLPVGEPPPMEFDVLAVQLEPLAEVPRRPASRQTRRRVSA
jgi:hypothetical protein